MKSKLSTFRRHTHGTKHGLTCGTALVTNEAQQDASHTKLITDTMFVDHSQACAHWYYGSRVPSNGMVLSDTTGVLLCNN